MSHRRPGEERIDRRHALGTLPPAVRVARSDTALHEGDEEKPPAVAEIERWEGEGGAVARPLSRLRREERRVAAHRA